MVSDARADPVVAAVLDQFPGAEIVDVRVNAETPAAADPDGAALPPEPEDDDD